MDYYLFPLFDLSSSRLLLCEQNGVELDTYPSSRSFDRIWKRPGGRSKGAEFVITRYRDPNCNLRTQLERILADAGVEPWPKLFVNLRSSRATELVAGHLPPG